MIVPKWKKCINVYSLLIPFATMHSLANNPDICNKVVSPSTILE